MRPLSFKLEGKKPGLHVTQRCFHWWDGDHTLYPSCNPSGVIMSTGHLSKCPLCGGKVYQKERRDELAVDVLERLGVKRRLPSLVDPKQE